MIKIYTNILNTLKAFLCILYIYAKLISFLERVPTSYNEVIKCDLHFENTFRGESECKIKKN